ncbi:proteasome activator complex subunit 2 [Eucyclogobius newberryi]|uniref:proteasome activator complex subunit 2 n=1 Tax=Eucyclogobius newberryi TaxID=166745 RepID=UPI003B59F7DB
MTKTNRLKISGDSQKKVDNFRQQLNNEIDNLFCSVIPQKIVKLDALLRDDVFTDTTSLRAPLDIPIPDPPTEEEEMETDKPDGESKKKKTPPKCGFIVSNERLMKILELLKPEIFSFRENVANVTCWINHLIPKIEDGNDFGVAIQEKILERIAAVQKKMDELLPNINKYLSERGDAVAKASKETHVMNYRSLVHEKDLDMFQESRVILLDVRGLYTELYDVINKNLDKVTNPKGEEKSSMY